MDGLSTEACGRGRQKQSNDPGNNQHNPQYANYWAPLTRKRHIPPHPAQPRHTNYWAPRTRKRHQQEHRPQRLTERSDPTQHAKGRTGDCPGPCKETTTRGIVTRGGGGGGGVRGQRKVCVPKFDLQFRAPLINVLSYPRKNFVMWVGGWGVRRKSPGCHSSPPLPRPRQATTLSLCPMHLSAGHGPQMTRTQKRNSCAPAASVQEMQLQPPLPRPGWPSVASSSKHAPSAVRPNMEHGMDATTRTQSVVQRDPAIKP